MPILHLHTTIRADIEIVFDLSRSIDLHLDSTSHTHERAIGGVTSGLIQQGESVTWRAKHLGVYQNLTSVITQMNSPFSFVDEMEKGAFKSFKHTHLFEQQGELTHMKDVFEFESPFGFIGRLFNTLFLKQYIYRLLEKRNSIIKEVAESNDWKKYLTNCNQLYFVIHPASSPHVFVYNSLQEITSSIEWQDILDPQAIVIDSIGNQLKWDDSKTEEIGTVYHYTLIPQGYHPQLAEKCIEKYTSLRNPIEFDLTTE